LSEDYAGAEAEARSAAARTQAFGYDPVAETTDAERDAAAEEMKAYAQKQAAERRERRQSEPPWKRTAPGEITFRDEYWRNSPSFLGPFGPGDKVTVNDGATGVIEYASDKGFLVMPEMGPGAHHLGYWIVGANVHSIRPAGWLDPGTPKPVDHGGIVHDSTLGDASLPMSPPPQPPGAENTFR
jgi:hypothetical protein